MKTRAAAVEDEAAPEKRRKVGNGESWPPASSLIQITTEAEEEEDKGRPCIAGGNPISSDHVQISCCSSNGSTEELQFTDLEESVDETRTVPRYNLETQSNSRIEFKAGSGLPETVTAKPPTVVNSRLTVPPEKIPPAAELEEFFASAEKDLHKRFRDKYNYDIEIDAPLEGRYEWVQVKP